MVWAFLAKILFKASYMDCGGPELFSQYTKTHFSQTAWPNELLSTYEEQRFRISFFFVEYYNCKCVRQL